MRENFRLVTGFSEGGSLVMRLGEHCTRNLSICCLYTIPVALGDKDSVFSGEGIRGQSLDVPVSDQCGLGKECSKGEVWRAGDVELTNLRGRTTISQRALYIIQVPRKPVLINRPFSTITNYDIIGGQNEKQSSLVDVWIPSTCFL